MTARARPRLVEEAAPAALPRYAVRRLVLTDYRCYVRLKIEADERPVVLFGPNGAGHVRACFATSYEQLIQACDRIERFVQGIGK